MQNGPTVDRAYDGDAAFHFDAASMAGAGWQVTNLQRLKVLK